MNLQKIKTSRQKQHKKIWRYIIILATFIFAAIAGAIFASSGLLDNKDEAAEEGMLVAKDKATIMIMGIDERDDDVGRSDTLMIATLDPKKHQAALLSVPRDTRVQIKGHGFDKINAAYAYGGEKLTENTVEQFLGMPMDHYVIINVKAFQRIIDALGGVDIDVEKRMYYEDPWDDDGGLVIDLKPGMQHMDGKTAVTYVRYRDEEGDIGRISRQQKFMKAVMDKATSPAIIPELPTIIKEVINSVKTDLSLRQMLEFAGSLQEAHSNGLKTEMVPGRPLYIDGISYWIPNITKLRQILADTLDITMNSSMIAAMEREDHEYESSIPATAAPVPATDTSIGHVKNNENKPAASSANDKKKKDDTTVSHQENDKDKPKQNDSNKNNQTENQPAIPVRPSPTPSSTSGASGKTM